MKDCGASGHEGRSARQRAGGRASGWSPARVLIPFAAALLAAGSARSAQLLPHGQQAAGESLAKSVCAACHGADGNSVDPELPEARRPERALSLRPAVGVPGAGPSTRERNHGGDGGESDRRADARCLGVFRRASSTRHRTAGRCRPVRRLLAQGRSIYRQGIAGNAPVPACASCHALSGAGLPPEFPRLAGQHEQYLVKQLEEFRSDRRNSNPNQMMSVVARKLSGADIKAVAGYIARMTSEQTAAR